MVGLFKKEDWRPKFLKTLHGTLKKIVYTSAPKYVGIFFKHKENFDQNIEHILHNTVLNKEEIIYKSDERLDRLQTPDITIPILLKT